MATPESASIDPTRLRRACAPDVANLSTRPARAPFCGPSAEVRLVEGGVLIGFALVRGTVILEHLLFGPGAGGSDSAHGLNNPLTLMREGVPI